MTLAGQQPSNQTSEGTVVGWDEHRQQDLLTALVAQVQDYAIVMLDVEGKIAAWNAGARRFKGYEAPQIIGRHFSVFYPPDDVATGKPERELEIAAADGRVEDEGWRVRKDGSRFWANVVITAVRDPDGTLLGYGKIPRDLTERQKADAELRSAAQEAGIMETTFSDAPGGVALMSMDGRFLRVNESLCQIFGRPEEAIVGVTSAGFSHSETAAFANIARAGAFARRLSELGCRFALDDFGAGFGSFYYLKHLPFDYLKIDGEFVAHCATNPTDRTLISAVVQIARGMGKQTIAEFVGDQDSVDILTDIGVDYGQGYFLGRPEPLTQHLAALTAAHAPAHSEMGTH